MNKLIQVAYNLYTIGDDGKEHLVERASAEHPFQFISGMGLTLDDFERQVAQLDKDAEFDFTLSVEQAYGPYMEEHVLDLDKEMFCIDGHFDSQNIFPGNEIMMMNDDGNRMLCMVKEVGDNTVKVDFNHPLAGLALHYKGQVVEAREATKEEIEGLINRMSGEGCGCGCHDCGDKNGCEGHHGKDCGHGDHCGHHHHE